MTIVGAKLYDRPVSAYECPECKKSLQFSMVKNFRKHQFSIRCWCGCAEAVVWATGEGDQGAVIAAVFGWASRMLDQALDRPDGGTIAVMRLIRFMRAHEEARQ